MANIPLNDSQWSNIMHCLRTTAESNLEQVNLAAELGATPIVEILAEQAADFQSLADLIEDSY